MNRITAYIRQSLQESYPQEEIKALSMLICCDMLGLDALDIYMGKDIILSECKQRELENIIFRLQKTEGPDHKVQVQGTNGKRCLLQSL